MTFDEFITKWNGRGIDFDGAYGDQCMDLMHQYHVEVLGVADGRTLAAPAAKDVYLQFETRYNNQLFEKIPNTPTGVPQKGDIVLWGTGIGPYGHVAMFISGDANKFKSFDQNFPTGAKCKIVDHNYTGVLGWLRFKGQVGQDLVCDTKAVRDMLVTKASQRDEVCTYLGLDQDPNKTDGAKITSTIGGFKSRITDLTNQITGAQNEVKTKDEQISNLQKQVLDEQNLRKELTDKLEKALKANSDVAGVYEGQLTEKQGVIDGLIKDKGNLSLEITQLQQKVNTLQKDTAKGLSTGDLVRLLIERLARK